MLNIFVFLKYSWALFHNNKVPWKQFDLFGSCLLGRINITFSLKLIIPHYWNKTLLSTLSNTPWIMRCSGLANKNRPYYWTCASAATVPSNHLWWFFPILMQFPHVHLPISNLNIQEWLCRYPDFSLCTDLSPPELCHENSSFLGPPGFSTTSSQPRESAELHLDSPLLYHSLKIPSRQ